MGISIKNRIMVICKKKGDICCSGAFILIVCQSDNVIEMWYAFDKIDDVESIFNSNTKPKTRS